jgi:hypothetical protein
MYACGTKPTCQCCCRMSVVEGEADLTGTQLDV